MSQEAKSGEAIGSPPTPGGTDVPPTYWDEKELTRIGVTGHAKVTPSDLTGVPHPIFARERWRMVDQSRFDAMHQSILLASYLLETGLPYIASFLPKPTYGKDSQGNKFVQLKSDVSPEEIQAARDELREITRSLEWVEDGAMLRKRGWYGSTSQEYPRPDKSEDYADGLRYWDRKCREAGHDRRQSTIFIAKEYIDVLLKKKKNSQEHITTAFHLALTLVHEIGHLIYWQDLDNKVELGQGLVEPWVAGQSRMGLGLAFTAWIFGGWCPYPISLPLQVRRSFISGMSWTKQLASEDGSESDLLDRPTWGIQYSMAFQHLQKIMTQKTWDDIGGDVDKLNSTRSFLPPEIPFRNGRDTRVVVCKKRIVKGQWAWKRELRSAYRFKAPPEEGGGEDARPSSASGASAPSEFQDPYWDDEPLSPAAISVLEGSEAESGDESEYQSNDESDGEFTDEYDDEDGDEGDAVEIDNQGLEAGKKSKKFHIRIIRSGIFNARTNTFEPFIQRKRPAAESNQEGPRKILKLAELMQYPVTELQNFCRAQHVAVEGTKEELAQRLSDSDKVLEPSPAANPARPAAFAIRVLISRRSTGVLLYQHIAKLLRLHIGMIRLMREGDGGKRVVLKYDDKLLSLDPQSLSNLFLFRIRSDGQRPPAAPQTQPSTDEKKA